MTTTLEEAKRKFHAADVGVQVCSNCDPSISPAPRKGAYMCSECEHMFFDDTQIDVEDDEDEEDGEDEDNDDDDEDVENDDGEVDEEKAEYIRLRKALKPKEKLLFESINMPALDRAIKGIQSMFTWAHSKEGDDLWRGLQNRLLEYQTWAKKLGK